MHISCRLLPHSLSLSAIRVQVAFADMTSQTALLTLVGPETGRVLEQLGAGDLSALPAGTHAMFGFQGQPVLVASGCGLDTVGATLLADESIAGALWLQICALGALPAGEVVWERARVAVGRPTGERELRAAFGAAVREADAGAEAAEELWGVALNKVVAVGEPVTARGQTIGAVTSFAPNPSPVPGGVALACVNAGCPSAFQDAGVEIGAAGVDGSLFAVAATPKRGAAVRKAVGPAKVQTDEERAAATAAQLRRMQEQAQAMTDARRDVMKEQQQRPDAK